MQTVTIMASRSFSTEEVLALLATQEEQEEDLEFDDVIMEGSDEEFFEEEELDHLRKGKLVYTIHTSTLQHYAINILQSQTVNMTPVVLRRRKISLTSTLGCLNPIWTQPW